MYKIVESPLGVIEALLTRPEKKTQSETTRTYQKHTKNTGIIVLSKSLKVSHKPIAFCIH